jgi:hypothetical protein
MNGRAACSVQRAACSVQRAPYTPRAARRAPFTVRSSQPQPCDLPFTAHCRYIATGAPLNQAFEAEGHAVAGEVVASAVAWRTVESFFTGRPADKDGGFFKVRGSVG